MNDTATVVEWCDILYTYPEGRIAIAGTERRTIRALRRAGGLTQCALADRVGVTKKSVSYWETARNEPSARQLRAAAEAFIVSMDAITLEREAVVQEKEERR
jgi:transcriptional regulator with XRE-family HTH domain